MAGWKFSTTPFQRVPDGKTSMNGIARKILLVDDEDAILFAFSIILNDPDIDVHTARTLNEAFALLQKNAYDIVIADLWLNGTARFDGLDVISKVAKIQRECKIIVMTAYGDEIIKNIAISKGADFYLEKPVSPQTLKKLIVSMRVGRSCNI